MSMANIRRDIKRLEINNIKPKCALEIYTKNKRTKSFGPVLKDKDYT